MSGFLDGINPAALAHIVSQRPQYFGQHFGVNFNEKNKNEIIQICKGILENAGYKEDTSPSDRLYKRFHNGTGASKVKTCSISPSPDDRLRKSSNQLGRVMLLHQQA